METDPITYEHLVYGKGHTASLVVQLVKNPPAIQETWVPSLGWGDLLEKGKAAHSSILVWRIPWTTVHGAAKSWTRLSDFHLQGKHCRAMGLLKKKVLEQLAIKIKTTLSHLTSKAILEDYRFNMKGKTMKL